jgi:tetratricopeptide (TPR) repeat protein
MLRAVKAHLDARHETGNNSTITALLATFLAETGEFDEAWAMTEAARAMSSPDDFGALVPVGWASGLIASASGQHDAALAALDEALALIRETDYLNFHADTLRIRGQVLWAAGRRDEAEASFAEALALFERKGNVASARRMDVWRDAH